MPTLHVPFLIVLLLLPNTTWHDWHASRPGRASTALQQQIAQLLSSNDGHCAIAVMNARTADADKITPLAGARTLLAGARLKSTLPEPASATRLGYAALAENLPKSLAAAGIAARPADAASEPLVAISRSRAGSRGEFIVATLNAAEPKSAGLISAWRDRVFRAGGRSALILASPNPSHNEYSASDQLTPILLWQPIGPATAPALLHSPSTRAAGLIANTDLAPTIAALAGARLIGPSFGSVCSSAPAPGREQAVDILSTISIDAADQARRQRSVPLLAGGLAMLIALASVLVFTRRYPAVARVCVYTAMSAPAVLICARTWPGAVGTCVALAAAAVLLTALNARSGEALNSPPPAGEPQWIATIYAAAVLVFIGGDALLDHARLVAGSLLGYSPLEGARYYGLGNEAMGIVAGAVTVLCNELALNLAANQQPSFKIRIGVGAALWGAAAMLLALPELGAKAGSIPVFAIGLTAFLMAARKTAREAKAMSANFETPPTIKSRAYAGCAGAAAALLLLCAGIAAMQHHSGQTHVGVAVEQAQRFGPGVYAQIAARKLAMDARLVLHSVWMLVLLAATGGVRLNARRWSRSDKTISPTLALGGAAVLACLLFNDAGVVAAALCSCSLWSYLFSRELEAGTKAKQAKINPLRRST